MKIIGHGGAAASAPRNSLAALQKAIDCGVDEIEFDVRVTADHVPVLHHHPYIETAGSRLSIHDHDYAEIKQHAPNLATLSEALDGINNKAVPHLEVKPGEDVSPIVTVLQDHIESGQYVPSRLLLASRSGRTLRQLHRALPDIPTSVIEFWSSIRGVYNARSVNTDRIDLLEYWLWSGLIRSLTKRGYKVSSFNSVFPERARLMAFFRRSGQCNDPRRLEAWKKAGLYGVITDFPDLFEK